MHDHLCGGKTISAERYISFQQFRSNRKPAVCGKNLFYIKLFKPMIFITNNKMHLNIKFSLKCG